MLIQVTLSQWFNQVFHYPSGRRCSREGKKPTLDLNFIVSVVEVKDSLGWSSSTIFVVDLEVYLSAKMKSFGLVTSVISLGTSHREVSNGGLPVIADIFKSRFYCRQVDSSIADDIDIGGTLEPINNFNVIRINGDGWLGAIVQESFSFLMYMSMLTVLVFHC